LLNTGLEVAAAVGLPVTTWRAGDPTKANFHYFAEVFAVLSQNVAEFARGAYLSTATGDWLTLYARETYGIERPEATYATGTALVIENVNGGLFEIEAGDLTFKASSTGKTFHNTTAATLSTAGETAELEWTADEAGSESSVGVDEIDEFVTSAIGLEIVSSDAGTARDAATDAELRDLCLDSRGAVSPNGPADAYEYVAKNSELTGVTDVTKAKSIGDADTGDVQVYIAGPDGAVGGASVAAVADAIAEWATPLCITPAVASAVDLPVTFTVTLYVRAALAATEADVQAAVEAALRGMVAELDIGGNDGYLHRALIISTMLGVYGPAFSYNATVAAPAADVAVDDDEAVSVSGTPTITVVYV
jgi:hypothetical protein